MCRRKQLREQEKSCYPHFFIFYVGMELYSCKSLGMRWRKYATASLKLSLTTTQNVLTFRVDPVFPRNYFTTVKCISWK